MSSVPAASPPTAAAPAASVSTPPPASAAEVDASCRWPVLVLVVGSLLWLASSFAFAFIASLKLHAPGFLAGCEWLTYGRVQPAAWNALVYGFGIQAGLAVALWMMARLGGVPLRGGGFIILGAVCWNAGLKLGVFGILAGDNTGVETLEVPGYASPILFLAYVLMAVWGVVSFHARRRPEVYVSQWYLLGALFSFPWLYSAANLLTVFHPLRGVLVAAAQGWYAHNLFTLWITFLGLAVLFYLLPKTTGVAIPSRSLAILGFWTLAWFGSFGGLQRYLGGPFPAWMISVSVVAGGLTFIPVLTVTMNLSATLRGQAALARREPVLWFGVFSFASYVVVGLLGVAIAVPFFGQATHFTLFTTGLEQLTLQGFFSMAMLGAFYYLAPQLVGCAWPSPRLVRFHFGCVAAGALLQFAALAIGGLRHGQALNDPAVPVLGVVKAYLPFAATGTLANLLFLAGSLALLANVLGLVARGCRARCAAVAKGWLGSPATVMEAAR